MAKKDGLKLNAGIVSLKTEQELAETKMKETLEVLEAQEADHVRGNEKDKGTPTKRWSEIERDNVVYWKTKRKINNDLQWSEIDFYHEWRPWPAASRGEL